MKTLITELDIGTKIKIESETEACYGHVENYEIIGKREDGMVEVVYLDGDIDHNVVFLPTAKVEVA